MFLLLYCCPSLVLKTIWSFVHHPRDIINFRIVLLMGSNACLLLNRIIFNELNLGEVFEIKKQQIYHFNHSTTIATSF